MAVLSVPRAWEVLEFGDGYLIVRLKDQLDVESVRVHEIAR